MHRTRFLTIVASVVFLLFLLACFSRAQETVRPWNYGYDSDNFRDMSNVENILAGNFTGDPSYLNEYRWYNHLVHWLEALVAGALDVPVNIILSKGGPYLNLLSPLCFFLMMLVFAGPLIAISATAGYLFFTSGNLPGYFSATYTPL